MTRLERAFVIAAGLFGAWVGFISLLVADRELASRRARRRP